MGPTRKTTVIRRDDLLVLKEKLCARAAELEVVAKRAEDDRDRTRDEFLALNVSTVGMGSIEYGRNGQINFTAVTEKLQKQELECTALLKRIQELQEKVRKEVTVGLW